MVRKLKYKFVGFAMLCVIIVLVFVVAALNIINIYFVDRMTTDILIKIADNNGAYPDFSKLKDNERIGFTFDENSKFDSSYFIVRMDTEGNISQHDLAHISSVTKEDAEEYVEKVMNKSPIGRIENYKYVCRENDNGKIFVFLDCGFQYQIFAAYFTFSQYISAVSILVIFIFVVIISGRVIAPTVEAVEKQKTFITNASHELKTPLAIIMANADVLEIMYEKNEWTDSIRNQSLRLNDLIKSMLILARFEDENKKIVFENFDASKAALEAAAPFKTSAYAKNNDFETDIENGITINGSQEAFKQLISVLLDNAVKYTTDGGKISIKLSPSEKSDKHIKLQISNTCKNMPSKNDMKKIFGRFYRTDSSRSRDTGGFGIGLSIALSVVNAHKWKIFARDAGENVICFTVLINPPK